MTSDTMDDDAVAAERFSALVDGELDGTATESACKRWKADAHARCTWHAYQLIGDVLRSDGLGDRAQHDEEFLVTLRARLNREPVVLAPAPLINVSVPSARRVNRWMLPSAMAAGLLLVVGTFTVLRPVGSSLVDAPSVAVADAGSSAQLIAASVEQRTQPIAVAMNGKMIRDARLERYLAAHKQFSGSSALGLPSAFLRGATVESDGR